jgi:hypothetical protein
MWNKTNTHDLSHVSNCISADETPQIIKSKFAPLAQALHNNGEQNFQLHTL